VLKVLGLKEKINAAINSKTDLSQLTSSMIQSFVKIKLSILNTISTNLTSLTILTDLPFKEQLISALHIIGKYLTRNIEMIKILSKSNATATSKDQVELKY